MSVERINPPELAKPSGFSHAVATMAERLVFLAGQTALDADGRIVEGGIVAQFERALGNLLTALRAAGGAPGDLVSLTIYIVDMDDYKANAREIGLVWRRLAGTEYPAMAGIGVECLWDAEALVEIKGVGAVARDPSAVDRGEDVRAGGLFQVGLEAEEQVGGADADPAVR